MRALALIVVTVGLSSCAVNSEADCQTLCTWWQRSCFAEPVASCMADCRESTESAAEGIRRCVRGEGWNSNPSTCQSAGCCVRFVYADYKTRC
jgi:hypothetical protein